MAVTPDEEELEDLFADLAADIFKPGALDIVIDEIVNPDFAIVSIDPPSKGTVEMIDSTTLQWKISELEFQEMKELPWNFILSISVRLPG